MHKYDVLFCHCGTLQLMPSEYYDWLEEKYQTRRVIRVCQHCGATYQVWLTEYDDGFAVNSCNITDTIIDENDKYETRYIFSTGIRVPMTSGNEAAYHNGNYWTDESGNTVVDTNRLIQKVRDEDKLKSIAAYVSGINWKGTPYEH